jgi:hypothetical protein
LWLNLRYYRDVFSETPRKITKISVDIAGLRAEV